MLGRLTEHSKHTFLLVSKQEIQGMGVYIFVKRASIIIKRHLQLDVFFKGKYHVQGFFVMGYIKNCGHT